FLFAYCRGWLVWFVVAGGWWCLGAVFLCWLRRRMSPVLVQHLRRSEGGGWGGVWGGVFFCAPVLRGHFAELCPATKHVKQEGGEPGQEARTVCPRIWKAAGVLVRLGLS